MKHRLVGAGVRGNTVIVALGQGRDSGWFDDFAELTPQAARRLAAWLVDLAAVAEGGADHGLLRDDALSVHVELLAAVP